MVGMKKNNELLEHLGIVNLETQTAPVIKEVLAKDFIEYGTKNYRNLYPQFLIDLYYNSSTHAAIINQTAAMIAGAGITIEDETNLDALVRLKKFINSANSKETLQEVMDKIAFDLKLQGAYALNVIWSKDRTSISEIWHIPCEKVRAGLPNEMGIIDTYYISSDWNNTRKSVNRPTPIKAFNTKDRTSANQILYSSLYSPMMEVYGTPDYSGCVNWCLTDQMVSEFHLSNIKNGFSGSYFISFNQGVPTREERLEIERQIERKFSGATNSGKYVLAFSDSKENEPTITPIQVSNADKQYIALQELLVTNILCGHRITSPLLMGIRDTGGGLGSNVDELNSAFEVYQNTVIKPFQANILKTLSKIFEVNDMNLPISIKQLTPITTKFDNETLKEVLTQDELRGELGLDPLEDDEVTAEDEVQMSKTPTDREILDYLEGLDLEDEVSIEDDYQLLDEEQAEDENHNYEFATSIPSPTGKAGKSNKDKMLFKIRYVYRGGSPIEGTREFCQTMWNSHYSSLFSREDITGMKNTEFGDYNIFRFKGSFNCRHYWLRRLYVLKKAPRTMTIDGKVYQKGDYLPKELKNYYPRNKGYVPADAGVPPLNSREREAGKINQKVVR